MKKGFTLVELLGVMVIISLVIAISFPIVIGVIKDKKQESEQYGASIRALCRGWAAHSRAR